MLVNVRHRRAARSPLEDMAFCTPSRVVVTMRDSCPRNICAMLYANPTTAERDTKNSLDESGGVSVWHPCKNGLDSQRKMQISAQCGSFGWLLLTSWAWWIWVIYWSCFLVCRAALVAPRGVLISSSMFLILIGETTSIIIMSNMLKFSKMYSNIYQLVIVHPAWISI